MTDDELRQEFQGLRNKLSEVKSEAATKGHTFIIIALIILLLHSC